MHAREMRCKQQGFIFSLDACMLSISQKLAKRRPSIHSRYFFFPPCCQIRRRPRGLDALQARIGGLVPFGPIWGPACRVLCSRAGSPSSSGVRPSPAHVCRVQTLCFNGPKKKTNCTGPNSELVSIPPPFLLVLLLQDCKFCLFQFRISPPLPTFSRSESISQIASPSTTSTTATLCSASRVRTPRRRFLLRRSSPLKWSRRSEH